MQKDLITLFDTSVASSNIGDYIIMDAVSRHSRHLRPDLQRVALPTHDTIGKTGREVLRRSELAIIGGTNLLSSHLREYRQWQFSLLDLPVLSNVLLMGVGWWQYQAAPDWISSMFYRSKLSSHLIHSVRDFYTANQLGRAGIRNVLNTGCPTLWDLTTSHCRDIPKEKAKDVVFTITDYKPHPERDNHLLAQLLKHYEAVHFWPQGSGDIKYLTSLAAYDPQRILILPANLHSFDELLTPANVDYVGTRLHAGIRAMQKKVRAWIVAVDNRASEMHKDFGLPVIDLGQLDQLERCIQDDYRTDIRLPHAEIEKWKSQPELLALNS